MSDTTNEARLESQVEKKFETELETEIEKGKLREPQDLPLAEDNSKPLISFDFDGVICRPPFGMNQVLGRDLHEEELPQNVLELDSLISNQWQKQMRRLRTSFFETPKYFGRKAMPGAQEGILAVSQYRTPVIITGRSFLAKEIVVAWLKKHNMEQFFSAVYANHTNLPTRQYKLMMLRRLNINEHVDDDGAISYYLAKKGIGQLYLRNWPRNQGLPYPPNVQRFNNISEIAQSLAQPK